jgi:signal transduction histidine kinase
MRGIILTTILIILLLAIAFWYLIHTIISLRSIEEMKDDFTNNMTHELKTPIAVTYSAVDTMLHYRQGDDKEKREQYLKICEATAEKAQRIGGTDSVDEHGEAQDAGDERRGCGIAAHDRQSWRRSSN